MAPTTHSTTVQLTAMAEEKECQPGLTEDDHSNVERPKALLRKIDTHLLPLLFFSYLLQYFDKTTLAYSAILGLPKETHLTGNDFSWASSAFYFGYMIASYPASIGFIKFPVAKFLAVCIILWGIILTCHGAASSLAGLATLRVLLGMFESTISPGFILVTGLWYSPAEHVTRTCLWFSGNAVGAIFGGLLAYGVAHIKHSLAPWQWLFIIFGVITFIWGIVLLLILPDSPDKARFLSVNERQITYSHAQRYQKTYKSKVWRKDQCIEALIDPKTWFLCIYVFTVSLPNGGLSNFSSLIIEGFGYDLYHTLLLGMVSPAVVLVFLLISAAIASKVPRCRCLVAASTFVVALVGVLLIRQLPTSNKWGRLTGLWLVGVYSVGFPISLSLVASNITGYTKKTTVNALTFVSYCVGNIAGPQLFIAKEAPSYTTAYTGIFVCFAIGTLDVLLLRIWMARENRQRDKNASNESPSVITGSDEDKDLSDFKNKTFRYIL